jgi:superfamily II DNA/RNA helicase
MGGNDIDKSAVIEQFRIDPTIRVLLSSEVASEGVDLQFSRFLINYDLPWNPMKVEQRIGRIDRLGQQAEKIFIWNLVYDDTIDSRILTRLYQRLDLFERALGRMEAILGEEIQHLTRDLLTGTLTRVSKKRNASQEPLWHWRAGGVLKMSSNSRRVSCSPIAATFFKRSMPLTISPDASQEKI